MKDRYALGPNIRHDAIRKTRSSGNYFVAVGDTEIDSNDLWKVKARHLWLRLTLNWLFSNLNVTFRQLEGKPFRTFVVYSEVVDSNIVGDQLHPLVHEVEYRVRARGWPPLSRCAFSGGLVNEWSSTQWKWRCLRNTGDWFISTRSATSSPSCSSGRYKNGAPPPRPP